MTEKITEPPKKKNNQNQYLIVVKMLKLCMLLKG